MKKISNFADIAFTDEVKKVQEEMGSRNNYKKLSTMIMNTKLSSAEVDYISRRDSFYMGTVNSDGFPYVQFRGGPVGFLVLDDETLGIIDFNGNRQYISTGNILENSNVSLFLMNYKDQQRLKIWAKAEVLTIDEIEEKGLYEKLHNKGYKTKEERAFIYHVKAFDWNCPKHIPLKYTLNEISQVLGIKPIESLEELRRKL